MLSVLLFAGHDIQVVEHVGGQELVRVDNYPVASVMVPAGMFSLVKDMRDAFWNEIATSLEMIGLGKDSAFRRPEHKEALSEVIKSLVDVCSAELLAPNDDSMAQFAQPPSQKLFTADEDDNQALEASQRWKRAVTMSNGVVRVETAGNDASHRRL